jgi:L-fucose isomerase-like protein
MAYPVVYDRASAPRLGVVCNAIGAFSAPGKAVGERKLTALFDALKAEGAIHADSVLHPRIFGPHEAATVADDFARRLVDVVLIFNSAFPNGHVFPTIALHPSLRQTPVIVSADYEPDLGDREWTTNAWCGVIMNNFVAGQVGRAIRPLPGDPASEAYADELKRLLNAYRAVALLRREFIGRFGDAPGGFHSATMDQFAFLRTFGVRLETVDLLAVMDTFRTGQAEGYCGTATFSDADVDATMQAMAGYPIRVADEPLRNGARFYHAMKALVEANGFTSVAVKCWPELLAKGLEIAACLPLTWLQSTGVVRGAACESDAPAAVLQSLAQLLTGTPAACLDFVNYPGRCNCVELGHCGVGIAGQMAAGAEIDYKSPDRQGGAQHAPALVGQLAYGVKTGVTLAPGANGRMKMLAFTGENSAESALGKRYAAADVLVREYRALDRLILREGFPHHLAVAMADITAELAEVCAVCGIDYFTPESA